MTDLAPVVPSTPSSQLVVDVRELGTWIDHVNTTLARQENLLRAIQLAHQQQHAERERPCLDLRRLFLRFKSRCCRGGSNCCNTLGAVDQKIPPK